MSATLGPSGHSRLAPSSSSRWLECPYSAQDDLPEDDGGAAATAGTEAHELAAFSLSVGLPTFAGTWHSEIITPYVNYVRQLPGETIHEQAIISKSIPGFGGTIDTLLIDWERAALHVTDLKTGKWKVPAKNNTQLQCYLLLAAEENMPEAEHYTGTIIQPQAYKKPNTAYFAPAEIEAFRRRVEHAATSTEKKTGDHCRFCPLRFLGRCDEGQAYAERQGFPLVK